MSADPDQDGKIEAWVVIAIGVVFGVATILIIITILEALRA